MGSKIRCAVLGLGRLGYWHAENLAYKIPESSLEMVVDLIPGRAEEVARKLQVPRYTEDPRDALTSDEIDAVIIVTPTNTHVDMIKDAAKHEKHIFVEKPITETVEEAEEVIDVINENGVTCQVGFMRRFDPAYVEARKAIASGAIGKPVYFKAVTRDGNVPHESFIEHSGGIFLDVAIHDYDIARYLLNDDVHSVRSDGNILLESNAFMEKYRDVDQGMTTLRFKSGAAGDIETMRVGNYGYDIRGEVIGTEGALQIGTLRNSDIKLFRKNSASYDLIQDFPTRFADAYLEEMIHFLECVRDEKEVCCTAEDGKIALEIAMAARKSFNIGQTVII